jgi:hypothetical protein
MTLLLYPDIELPQHLFAALIAGNKFVSICPQFRRILPGVLCCHNGGQICYVRAVEVVYQCLRDLGETLAHANRYPSLALMREAFQRENPGIRESTLLTIIRHGPPILSMPIVRNQGPPPPQSLPFRAPWEGGDPFGLRPLLCAEPE